MPLKKADLEFEFYKAQGPGGQHRNKVATAVRLTHIPTGFTVSATERRSRTQNLEKAIERLKIKLARAGRKEKPRVPTKPSKAARRKRLEAKKARSSIKKQRGRVTSWS
ncbi:peptidyl-tRNA hydrolase [Dethiosulfatarculus sandiegensis]|uniref:Peptidyl-tRNA hydrolase n=1 Tax=Dethiosulfatarculus sandiegensis TaxID=1429043 RepID=A0A0D2JQU8_9BACT|nr:peptidyl-tRNA hydrolase [Dethiosulfatarculus sandiegensis]